MPIEQGECWRALLKGPVGMPSTTEYEGCFFGGFLDHVYHVRMIGHAGHIGFAAKLTEVLGNPLQVSNAQGLVADEDHLVGEQRLAQLGKALVAQTRQIKIFDVRTDGAGGRGYTNVTVTGSTVMARQGVDELAHGSHSCCFEVITECEVTARLDMMITAKK